MFRLEKFSTQNLCDKPLLNAYQENGIIYLKNFLSSEQCDTIQDELIHVEKIAAEDIRNNWQDKKVYFYSKNPNKYTPEIDYVTTDYFLKSAQRTHNFYELLNGKTKINRIGHGLHLDSQCREIQNLLFKNHYLHHILKTLEMQQPICHLSVYIPKHARGIGSDVRPHQESTFAFTEPQTTIVLWIALEDALIENACMWGILGSHHWPLKFVSRVDHGRKQRYFEKLNDIQIPEFDPDNKTFTPLEVKANDALLFHGNFVHCSPVNNSNKSRKALSFQFIDTVNCIYSATNWLQPINTKYLYKKM